MVIHGVEDGLMLSWHLFWLSMWILWRYLPLSGSHFPLSLSPRRVCQKWLVVFFFSTVSLRSLCFLDSWLPWKTSSGSRPVKGMEGDGDGRVGINVEMQTHFPIRGDAAVQPCFDWLAAPAAQRRAAFTIFQSSTEQWPSWYARYNHEYLQSEPLHACRWRLCT